MLTFPTDGCPFKPAFGLSGQSIPFSSLVLAVWRYCPAAIVITYRHHVVFLLEH
jgi:hypothetical protein